MVADDTLELMLELLFAAIFGLVVGSFLNVVIFRYNTGSGIGGRSRCLSCAKTLEWYELIPVVSYLAQRGRCRGCFSPFSAQYALVELITAALFALTWNLALPLTMTLGAWIAISLLVVISAYDARHTIIPDGPVFTLIFLGLLRILFLSIDPVYDLLSGLFWPLGFWIIWFASKGEWMGFGDVKLALAIGWLLPFPFNIFAVMFSFWLGALWGVGVLFAGNLFGRKGTAHGLAAQIPFGPFLVLGALIEFFCQIRLW